MDHNKTKLVEVYAESTPNPAAMKFVVNRMLLAEGVVEYFKKEDAVICPLAVQLFGFSGVRSVFITSNFITVTKDEGLDWYDIMPILREAIKGFFQAGEKLFLGDPFGVRETEEPSGRTAQNKGETGRNEIEERIIGMLDEYVRPAVEQDGGAIHFQAYHDGVVTLLLKGSCSGCPSSMVTLKGGIENLLKKMIPEVREVQAVEA